MNHNRFFKFFSNKNNLLITIVLIVIFLVIYFNSYYLSSLLSQTTATIQQPFNDISTQIKNLLDTFNNYQNLDEENSELKTINVELTQENISLQNLKDENKELKDLLNYTEQNSNYTYITAKIFAKDFLNIADIVSIDQGSKNSIEIGNTVIHNHRYIGHISETKDFTASVDLITSPNHMVVAQIPEINTNGIVHGQIGYGLIMIEIPPDAPL
ncbi:rod shape-determining protein MreC, partial [Patescibacteria group bacterium]|nr:rod shape-determining protein MreC [Patescibacteria group bacterium]